MRDKNDYAHIVLINYQKWMKYM